MYVYIYIISYNRKSNPGKAVYLRITPSRLFCSFGRSKFYPTINTNKPVCYAEKVWDSPTLRTSLFIIVCSLI